MSKGNIARIWFKGFCPVKSRIKYAYYKISSILLGKASLDYARQGCGHWLARLLPGRSSAVLLTIKGKLSGVGYNRWLRSNARAHKVSCWIRRRDKNTVEALFVGRLKRVYTLADLVKSLRFTRIDEINERWLVKEKAKELAALMGSLGGEEDGGRKFTITFAGDTSLGDNDLRKRRNKDALKRLENEPLSFFKGVTPLIKNTDHLIVNVETVLAKKPSRVFDKNYLKWDDPERTVNILKKIGVTAASLANNHIMDYGADLMLSTKNRLIEAGIACFGVGTNLKEAARPLKLPLEGRYSNKNIYIFNGMRASKRYWEKYRFFAGAENPGVNSLNERRIGRSIARIRKKYPEALIIICPHWQGLDYKWANDRLVQICRGFIDKGADLVIGHGPHMMQQVEQYSSGLIVYSLGNFVFNTGGEYKKRGVPPYSLIARLEIREKRKKWSANCKLYPILTDNRRQGFCSRPVTRNEANDAYAQLAAHSLDRDRFTGVFNLAKDRRGWYFNAGESEKVTKGDFGIGGAELVKYLSGEKSIRQIDFNNIAVLEKLVGEMEQFHLRLDKDLKVFYRHLFRSKLLRPGGSGEYLYKKLSDIVKRDYVSFTISRKFALRRLNIRRAISFRDILVERSEIRRLGRDYDIAKKLNNKKTAYMFADKIGLRRPVTDPQIYKFDEIEPQTGPVVIKPLNATGSMGVYLIFNKNKIFSARDGVFLSDWDELVKDVTQKMHEDLKGDNKYFKRDQWMIEELILSPESDDIPASDLKFFSFYGEVVMVLEINRVAHHKKYCYWDKEMNLIKTGRHDLESQFYKGAGFSEEDLEIVVRTSLQIPTPFVRIDMLKGRDGLVFGEFQFITGNFEAYNDEYDRKLGEAYRIAEQKIIEDLLRGKTFEAFSSLFLK
jgi:poly-gamma-glutamate capsule biosynthesis protein CapA/YwtB (metallophosphatase superfamily)/acylphosphatase